MLKSYLHGSNPSGAGANFPQVAYHNKMGFEPGLQTTFPLSYRAQWNRRLALQESHSPRHSSRLSLFVVSAILSLFQHHGNSNVFVMNEKHKNRFFHLCYTTIDGVPTGLHDQRDNDVSGERIQWNRRITLHVMQPKSVLPFGSFYVSTMLSLQDSLSFELLFFGFVKPSSQQHAYRWRWRWYGVLAPVARISVGG